MRSLLLLLASTSVVALSSPVIAQQNGTAPPARALFTVGDAKFIGALVGGTALLMLADRSVAATFQDDGFRADTHGLQNAAQNFRSSSTKALLYSGLGAYAVGFVSGVRPLADLGLHGLEAGLLAQGVAYTLKGATGRARPGVDIHDNTSFGFRRGYGDSKYASFPSGYTLLTFSAATALVTEVNSWSPRAKWIVGPLAYGGASLVALNRLYDNKHWISDVFMGAGLGVFIGHKVVTVQHRPRPHLLDRILLPHAELDEENAVRLRWVLPTGGN